MTYLRRVLRDRKAAQRGSVLSGLLIMVAFLSILIGALMTELSSAFLVSSALNGRVQREATDNSAVELGLYQLANSAVPPVCVRDNRGPWYVGSLNGNPAAVTQSCTGIVPDADVALPGGAYNVNGMHEVTAVHNGFVVGDSNGMLRSYPFGSSSAEWTIATGGAVTGPALGLPDPNDYPDIGLAVPDADSSTGCSGHCVMLFNQRATGAPSRVCVMPSVSTVINQPAAEVAPSGSPSFPSYVFFVDSDGHLYVYDGSSDGSCAAQADLETSLGGTIVGQPLVYTGVSTSKSSTDTKTADIFAVVSGPTWTNLDEWQYAETTSASGTTKSLVAVASTGIPVDGQASVSGPSGAPSLGATVRLAVAGASGQTAFGRITVSSSKQGPVYALSSSGGPGVGGPVVAAPYWCHCPGGDAIGVGSANGSFYLLDTSLNLTHDYSVGAPIRTTPTADVNGDWYVGADDGNVYDVEVPTTGMQMFNAAVFPLGGAIRSAPVEGACGTGICLYFGSSTAGGAFVKIGTIRIIDLRACVTSAPSSVSCSANPRLWTRAKIGPAALVGGSGISVQGWSYYSP